MAHEQLPTPQDPDLRSHPLLRALGGVLRLFTPSPPHDEQRHFGPKGGPFNPPIREVPGDLQEDFRLRNLYFLMGRSPLLRALGGTA